MDGVEDACARSISANCEAREHWWEMFYKSLFPCCSVGLELNWNETRELQSVGYSPESKELLVLRVKTDRPNNSIFAGRRAQHAERKEGFYWRSSRARAFVGNGKSKQHT